MARRRYKRDQKGRFARVASAAGKAAGRVARKAGAAPRTKQGARSPRGMRAFPVEEGVAERLDRAVNIALLKPVVDAVAGNKLGRNAAKGAQKKIQRMEQKQMRGKKIVSEKF